MVLPHTSALETGAYVCLTLRTSTSRGLMFGFYFLRNQGVVRLTVRVLDLVKTILLKTFVDRLYGKDFK
jgi:hypothetical protein